MAGPWVEELSRAWNDAAALVGQRNVRLDLRDVTYSDPDGNRVLRGIFQQTHAEIVTKSPWSEYLADQIRNGQQA